MKQQLRHDKVCLNCGAIVAERYCTRCGQENVEIKETFSHLVKHFFSDVIHYDSKFLTSIKDLLFRPGFLTKEYVAGKRAKYLHPIRMYIFISFLYFLSLLIIKNPGQWVDDAVYRQAVRDTWQQISDSLHRMVSGNPHRMGKDSVIKNIMVSLHVDSLSKNQDYNFTVVGNIDYKQLKSYDSAQQMLPPGKRQKGLKPWLYHRWLTTINHYGRATVSHTAEKTLHFIPKLMFFFLPLFALLLKLFYSRKKYYYADHAIFSLHLHSAIFLLFLFFDIVELLFPSLLLYIPIVEFLLAFIYLVMALRNAYKESLWISFFKGIFLSLSYLIFILAGFIVFTLSTLL